MSSLNSTTVVMSTLNSTSIVMSSVYSFTTMPSSNLNSTTFLMSTTNSTISPTSSEDWFKFDDYAQRVVVAVMFIIASIVGTVGNTVVIAAVALSRKLRTITNVFVINLAVADLLTSLCVPWNAVALLSRDGWPLPPWICSIAGAIMYLCIAASFYSLASVAVNRFILITKDFYFYQKVFTTVKLVIWISLIWLISFFVVVFLPIVDIGGLGYNEKYSTCGQSSSHPKDDIYQVVQAIGAFPIPLFIIVYCYVRIFMHVRRHLRVMSVRYSKHDTSQTLTDSTVADPPTQLNEKEGERTKSKEAKTDSKEEGPCQTGETTQEELPVTNSKELPEQDNRVTGEKQNFPSNSSSPSDGQSDSPVEEAASPEAESAPGPRAQVANSNDASSKPSARKTSLKKSNINKSSTRKSRSTITTKARGGRTTNKRQVQITKNMFMVVCAFFVCLAPFIVCLVYDDSDPFVPYASALVLCNACVNPFIYATKHPVFKNVMRAIVTCRFSQIPEPTRMLHRMTTVKF